MLSQKIIHFLIVMLVAVSAQLTALEDYSPRLESADGVEVYKIASERELIINIFDGRSGAETKHPVVMFFFGGGWVQGSTGQFERQARFLAERGYTVVIPDYRVLHRDGPRMNHAVDDAADAYRWLLENADRLSIDTKSIFLCGGSAGGYLALSIPLLHPDLPLPAGLVVYNPVTQTTPGGYYTPGVFEAPGDVAKFSLHDKVRSGLPPILILHGDEDKTVPYGNSVNFTAAWKAAANEAKLVTYPGVGHGFFNSGSNYQLCLDETLSFLELHGPLQPVKSPVRVNTESDLRPNILFILADDLGYSDPGFLGGDIQTPNLDRLAKEGRVFGRFINHAKCEPSRTSLMTGVHFQRQTQDHVTREFHNVATIAERLRSSGYRTMATGKWHLPGKPTEHGFDRFFGLLGGAANHFDPTARLGLAPSLYLHREFLLNGEPYVDFKDAFYSTDAFTDYAVEFIKETPVEQPFFLYLAYTAPHWPLQAPVETIEKYKGRYDLGWDALQKERFEHMRKAGVLPPEWSLPPLPATVPEWAQTDDQKADAQCMEVHAAMVDRMDQGIGRLIDELEKNGRLQNTLILFTSDNGAIGAIGQEARFDRTPTRPAGPVDSFRMLPEGFVHAVNAPWRGQKLTHLAGGDTSPLIVYWPGKVPAGIFSWETINILDMMPTFLAVSGATYPKNLQSLDGRDVSALLTKQPVLPSENEVPHFLRLVFSEADEHAIIEGRWKAYRSASDAWSLYDLVNDGTETNDLGKSHPETLKNLVEKSTVFENQVLGKPPTK